MSKVRLIDICQPKQWKTIPTSQLTKEGYPVYGANGKIGFYSEYNHEKETILITCRGATCGSLNISEPFSYVNGNAMCLDNLDDSVLLKYLYYNLCGYNFSKVISGTAQPQITGEGLSKVVLNIHSANEQKIIVDLFEKLEKILISQDLYYQKLDELIKSRFVEMFGDTEINSNNFPVYKLNDLCTVSSSKRIYQEEQSSSGVPFLRISNLVELIDNNRVESELFIPEEKYIELSNNDLVPKADDILITSRGTLGKCYIIQEKDKFYFQDGMISWLYNLDKCITPLYITFLFETRDIKRQIENLQSGSTVAYLSIAMLKKLSIVVPPLDMQQQFADFVAQTDKSKLVVKKQIEKLETLKKSLMQEYFG